MSEKPQQVPSVGRVVHYVYGGLDGPHYAALITGVDVVARTEGSPDLSYDALTVFPPQESIFFTSAPYSADMQVGTWHWPEFVPSKP
jgi:hypothetical protein